MRTASKIVSLGLVLAIALPPSAVALADEPARVALAPIVPIFGNLPGAAPHATADRVTELLAQELRRQDGLQLVPLPGSPAAAPASASPTPSPAVEPKEPVREPVRQPAKPKAPAKDPAKDIDDDEGGGDSAGESAAPFQGAGDRAFAKGMAAVAKGKKDMQRLKFDAAATELRDGIAGIEGAFDLLGDYGTLVDAYLQLAIAELRLDQREAGQQALAAVIRLAPEQSLTGSYPAVFTRMFNGLKQQLVQGPKGTVAAASTPSGQLVRVDGRDAGVTPVSLDLIPGAHFIVVSGEGGKLNYRINVEAGTRQMVGNGEAPGRAPVKPAAAATPETKPVAKPTPSKPANEDPLATLLAEISANNIDDRGGRGLAKLAAGADNAAILFGGIHYLDEDQSTVVLDTMLYAPATNEVAALTSVQFDADLTGAPVELLKVAAEAAQHLAHWSDVVGLPQPVAPGLKPPKVVARLAGASEARKPAAKPEDEGLPAGHTRRFEAHSDEVPDLGPAAELVQKPSGSGSFPWVPVGIGVGAAAAVAVVVVVLVVVLNQKPGVNSQVSW